jgi:hypothetical protein
MNYLFFMPSLLTRTQKLLYQPSGDDTCREYYDDSEKGFSGIQTNIAATKYIIAHLLKQGQKLDKILMLCSKEVLSKTIKSEPIATPESPISTYEYYVSTISDWACLRGYTESKVKSLFAPLNLENLNPGSWSQMHKTLKSFLQEADIKSTVQDKLFIDYTGGNRSASMILIAVARFLECKGIKVEKVLYSNIIGSDKINTIEDCMETYKLLSAIGNDSDALLDIYKSSGEADQIVIQEVQKTADADLMNQNGQNAAVADDVKKKIENTADSFISEMIVDGANKRREKLTLEGTILEAIEKKNAKKASELIRENIVDILEKKGIISWSKRDDGSYRTNKKDQPVVFYAFCKYYASFLKYVDKMIKEIADSGDLQSDFYSYLYQSKILKKSQRRFANTHWSIDKDFRMAYPDIVCKEEEYLSHDLTEICSRKPLSVEAVRERIDQYQETIQKYQNSYFKPTCWGFPFANYYKNRTCSVVHYRGEDRLLADLYIESLEKSIEWVSTKSTSVRRSTIDDWLNNEDVFLMQFRPLDLRSPFKISKSKISQLDCSRLLVLLDANRDARNAFVHSSGSGMNVILSELERINKIIDIVGIK